MKRRSSPVRRRSQQGATLVALLLVPLFWAPTAAAKCHCFCKASFDDSLTDAKSIPSALLNYSPLKEWGNCTLKAGDKRRDCNDLCAEAAADDAAHWNNDEWLCAQIGGPFDGYVTAYAGIGTGKYSIANQRKVRCRRCCDCPEGTWFDANRDSCVTGAGCDVEDLPNGDKGGGFFAWDGHLFVDVPGGDCWIQPGDEPCPSCEWTPWLDRDNPGGVGDYETLADFVAAGQACPEPQGIECQTVSGVDWTTAGQVYTCQLPVGGVCINSQQANGTCLDYRVRFRCCK